MYGNIGNLAICLQCTAKLKIRQDFNHVHVRIAIPYHAIKPTCKSANTVVSRVKAHTKFVGVNENITVLMHAR